MAKQLHDKIPNFFKDAVRDRKVQAQKTFPSRQLAAFLDFDGSLIEGDITEGFQSGERAYAGLLERAILDGHIPGYVGKEGLASFWKNYEEGFDQRYEAYLWAAKLVANLPGEHGQNLSLLVQSHLKEMVKGYLFSFARDLLKFCEEEGIAPIIVSASPHAFVRELHHALPIASHNLFGLNAQIIDDKFVDPIQHDGPGKELRLKELCASRSLFPILAMGNKWRWDGMMIRRACEEGGIGLLVNEGGPSNYTHSNLFYFDIC